MKESDKMDFKTTLLSNLKSAYTHMIYVCDIGFGAVYMYILNAEKPDFNFNPDKCRALIQKCREYTKEELSKMDKNDPWYLWKKSNNNDPELGKEYTLDFSNGYRTTGIFTGETWKISNYAEY